MSAFERNAVNKWCRGAGAADVIVRAGQWYRRFSEPQRPDRPGQRSLFAYPRAAAASYEGLSVASQQEGDPSDLMVMQS